MSTTPDNIAVMKTCRSNLHTYSSTARTCPECNKARVKAWHEAHKQEQQEKRREAYKNNREERLAKMKIYRDTRKEELATKKREWYAANQEYARQQKRDFRAANPEKAKAANLKWANANRELKNAKQRAYYAANKEKCLADTYKYKVERIATDPLFKLRQNLGSLIGNSLRKQGFSKKSKTHELVGCSYDFLFEYLKQTAIKNYGSYDPQSKYEIDHITPCSSVSTEQELIALQHYLNLQFLTPEDNNAKKAKLDWKL